MWRRASDQTADWRGRGRGGRDRLQRGVAKGGCGGCGLGGGFVFSLLSDRCSESYPVVFPIKLGVVARNEVGSQNPNGPSRGRHVQPSEGDSAHVALQLGVLQLKQYNVFTSTQIDVNLRWECS